MNRSMEIFVCLLLVLCLLLVIQFSEINQYKKENKQLKEQAPSVLKTKAIKVTNNVNNSELLQQSIVKEYLNIKVRKKVADLLIDTFANRHVVFVGDSLTRYHYLSFVYTLKFGEAMDPLHNPSIVEQVQWGSWFQFYKGSNKLLAPNEKCDCFRPAVIETPENVFENRYYHDPKLNIAVTYIQFFSYYAHGHWTPTNNFSMKDPPLRQFVNPAWQHYLKDLFPRHIATLKQRPSIAVMNVGLWPNKFYDLKYAEQVVASVLPIAPLLIWRTTTSKRNEPVLTRQQQKGDINMCSNFSPNVTCMNVSWVLEQRDMYLDYVHFREPVYTKMNEQLAYTVRNSSVFREGIGL